ncbi:uncharacterized protein LOC141543483 isoform X2 [Sminthopsis crassicaudata]
MGKIHHRIFTQDMVPKKNLEEEISVIPGGPPHHGAPLGSNNANVSELKGQEDITETSDLVQQSRFQQIKSFFQRGRRVAPLSLKTLNVSELKGQEDITETSDLVQQSRFQQIKSFFQRGRRVAPLSLKTLNVSELKGQEDITETSDLVHQSRFQQMKTFLCRGHRVEPLKIKAIKVEEVTPINKLKEEEEPSWIKNLSFAVPPLTLAVPRLLLQPCPPVYLHDIPEGTIALDTAAPIGILHPAMGRENKDLYPVLGSKNKDVYKAIPKLYMQSPQDGGYGDKGPYWGFVKGLACGGFSQERIE